MLRYVASLLFLFLPFLPWAHPSWGLVARDNGDIYFMDIYHNRGTLWKWDTKGQLTAVKKDWHVHALARDRQNNLYAAKYLWIQGEIEGEGHNYLFRLRNDEQTDTLIFTNDRDHFYGINFTIDDSGRVYAYIDDRFSRLTVDGKNQEQLGVFKGLSGMHTDARGQVWIVMQDGLFRLLGTRLVPFATGLQQQFSSPNAGSGARTMLMGIGSDGFGNIYLSDYASRQVMRFDAHGKSHSFYTSPNGFHPVNCTFFKEDAYILEIGDELGGNNAGPQLVKIDRDGERTVVVNVNTHDPEGPRKAAFADTAHGIRSLVVIGGLLLAAIAILLYFVRQKRRLHSGVH